MTRTGHKLYIGILVSVVAVIVIILTVKGYSYYSENIEERFYHPDNAGLKPSGIYGHGMGIAGSLCMIVGMGGYMARKRYRVLSRFGALKYWLEFHIFLCTMGPMLVLFHTSFKIGGLVAVSFWSMVIVFFSGIIGRFIYIRIPHSIEGRELSLKEVQEMKADIAGMIRNSHDLDERSYEILTGPGEKISTRKRKREAGVVLRKLGVPEREYKKILALVVEDIRLSRKIEHLGTMQNLFRYWHVAHLPFALIMLIIMFVHVGVAILFGYKWIF